MKSNNIVASPLSSGHLKTVQHGMLRVPTSVMVSGVQCDILDQEGLM